MNFVKCFNFSGVEVKEIPCILGNGAPTTSTVGAFGVRYKDIDTGLEYECTSVENGVYTWELPKLSHYDNDCGFISRDDLPSLDLISNPSLYLYSSLSEAISKVNADDFSEYVKPETPKVSVLRYGPGNYRIDLLEDVSETIGITISKNVYLSLNGKTLSFTGSGSGLIYSEGINCVINGKVEGSSIVKNVSSSNKEQLIDTWAKNLKLLGGSYSLISSSNVDRSIILVIKSDLPTNHSSMTYQERIDWLKSNRSIIPNIEMYGCSFISVGGKIEASALVQTAYIKCSDCKWEIMDSPYMMGIKLQFADADITNCRFNIQCSHAESRCEAIGTMNGGTVIARDNAISINGESLGKVYGIMGFNITDSSCKALTNSIYIDIDYTEAVTSVTGMSFTRGEAIVQDSKVIIESPTIGTANGILTCESAVVTFKNCKIESPKRGLFGSSRSLIKVVDCVLSGYSESIVADSAEINLKDCEIISGVAYGKYASSLSSITPDRCGYLNAPVSFDNCSISVGSKVLSLFEIYNSSVGISNCTIKNAGNRLMRLKSATSQLNIGSGNNFTSDIVDVGSGKVDSTNELYRFLIDTEQCSGKDLKVYFDYINKSITSQLSTIVDGEVS